ncbi:carboxypeptidase C [Marasmius fiardii PR-910]|nr:carboxypeptidase C [Marasmius fiardii PR-910]
MRSRIFLPLLLSTLVLASPRPDGQVVLGNLASEWDHVRQTTSQFLNDAQKSILRGKADMEKWFHDGKQYIKQNELLYELVSHPMFNKHQLRVTEPKLCDPDVKQYSGYLDISESKHLFFWFFEAREAPEKAPLLLWLNGGPGCSSSTGLLFELGPCSVTNEGHNTTLNPYSWNQNANIIFLDQPVQVGYSYDVDGDTVSTSPVAGQDVNAFLQLFLNRFPKYSSQPFHLAAESYGGTYGPNIAHIIHKKNKELSLTPNPRLKHINLASVILANGLTDPLIQYGSVADYACEGPYPVYPDPASPQCAALRTKIPTCERLIGSCYNFNSKFTCVPAVLYCNSQIMGPLVQTGLNPYDVRKKCDRTKDGDLCYKQMGWIDVWMNDPKNKIALGANPQVTFQSCNLDVNKAFTMQGDGMHNSALLLPDLIEDGVRLLVYAGNADMMCNFMGNERWVEALDTQFKAAFAAAKSLPWIDTAAGRQAGAVRTAGGSGFTAGNVTFVEVYEAGHMVPYDQPSAALDLITRWLKDAPLN